MGKFFHSRKGRAIRLIGPAIVWFRRDLRLLDNPALAAAVHSGAPILPVFIWSPEDDGAWRPGAASRWWLHRSLASLNAELEKRGSRLILRRGPARQALHDLVEESGATSVFWNRRYEPDGVDRDTAIMAQLKERGITVKSFAGSLLFEPWTIRNGSGQPFRVFTPFWRACLTQPVVPPAPEIPESIAALERWPHSVDLSSLKLDPAIDWAGGLRETWQPGTKGAARELKRFQKEALREYAAGRDIPGKVGTSRLSPHLHFGEISPGQIWRAIREVHDSGEGTGHEAYLRQLGWREFAHQLLYHHPQSPEQPMKAEFARFPWKSDPSHFRAWTLGQTGYPFVDAGMRELWHTGWMHNRVRMVVASFLVKHLLIGWQDGAAWFWDTLVDADLANNTMGWQWVAGCGADAAPFFRIFNPVIQGEKFDPTGAYVRRWVPELANLPDKWIHKPAQAPALTLAEAGVELGKTYPFPIVDHDAARKRALEQLRFVR